MNPNHLYNDVFWEEPNPLNELITNELERHNQHLESIININQRHNSELNGEGTSRIPLIEPTHSYNNGRRFHPY
jgi:hypothetical protein